MRKILIASVLAAAGLASAAHAQITSGNSPAVYSNNAINYSQNFNGLASAGINNAWTQNSTVLGWRGFYANTGAGTVGARNAAGSGYGVYNADDGSTSNQASAYSYGSIGSSDRALGAMAYSTAFSGSGQRRGDYVFWVAIRNDTDAVDGIGSILDTLNISYRGEQWRNQGHNIADSIVVDYRVYAQNALTSTDPSNNTVAGWTALPTMTFTSPTLGSPATALDGNAPANSALKSVTLSGLSWKPGDANGFGETLVVRFWIDARNSFSNAGQGLAIDDVQITATPTPGIAGVLGLGALVAGRRRRA